MSLSEQQLVDCAKNGALDEANDAKAGALCKVVKYGGDLKEKHRTMVVSCVFFSECTLWQRLLQFAIDFFVEILDVFNKT